MRRRCQVTVRRRSSRLPRSPRIGVVYPEPHCAQLQRASSFSSFKRSFFPLPRFSLSSSPSWWWWWWQAREIVEPI
jgi:hypothetical protein